MGSSIRLLELASRRRDSPQKPGYLKMGSWVAGNILLPGGLGFRVQGLGFRV